MKLVRILTKTEILLNSDMLGAVIAYYLFLLGVLIVSFVNIYTINKKVFLNSSINYFL